MKGKFRKRSETVWCPKPKTKTVVNNDLSLSTKNCKVTGWIATKYCEVCPSLEEIHDNGDGVFCLYPKTNANDEMKK